MAISFRNIPPNLRVPLAYFEFDPSLAGTATSLQNALLLGTVADGEALEPNTLTVVFSADQVRALVGIGSALGRQAEAWFRNNASVPLSILAAPQTGFTEGIGSIEWAGPAIGGGVIPLYIGGRIVQIIVSPGDDDVAISAAAVGAINADERIAVTAAVSTVNRAITEITAAQAGVLGNLKIQFALAGAVGGEIMPEGVTATVVQMTDTAAGGTPGA